MCNARAGSLWTCWNLIPTWNSSIQLWLQKKNFKLCVKTMLGNRCSWRTSAPVLRASLSKWAFSIVSQLKECIQTKRTSKEPCITPVSFHLWTLLLTFQQLLSILQSWCPSYPAVSSFLICPVCNRARYFKYFRLSSSKCFQALDNTFKAKTEWV